MPNFGYHLARARARLTRVAYRAALPAIVARPVRIEPEIPLEVYAYSGESALPEQVASIRSFLRHAGRPRRFTVVSDGTHSSRSRELLQRLDPSVVVSSAADWVPAGVPPELIPYLTEHPTGKQLALIMCLPSRGPALYVDSDVLFFAGARSLATLAASTDAPALYLADCQLAGDQRLFRTAAEKESPVNTGVLLLLRTLDWSLAVTRLLELPGAPTFFTNQTATHLAMHANRAQPFVPRKFVLQLDDQFVYADAYAGPHLVLRHYVNPVRHKFWTSLRSGAR